MLTHVRRPPLISQNQRLIITYQTQLDANSQNGGDAHATLLWRQSVGSTATPATPTRKTFTGL